MDFLFTLDQAAVLIPMSNEGLRKYLSRHKEDFPRRYRVEYQGSQRRLHRYLTSAEIKDIRRKFFRYKNPDLSKREPDEYAQ